jgi:hypothetical protein
MTQMPSPDGATTHHEPSHARPLYYLVAPVGHPNFGDDLIAATWLRHLAETAPGAEVWVDTHSPGPAAILLDGCHPNVRFTDTLWRLCWKAPTEGPWQAASWVQEVVHNPGMVAHLHHGIELLARADVVHVLGGGYINKIWPTQIGLLAGAAAAVRRSGGRAAMTGQGLQPAAEDAGPLLRTLADHFEVVEVRDDPSAELLGTTAGVDDAFLGLGPVLYADGDDAPEVMLCLQSDLVEAGIGKLAGAVLSMVRSWRIPSDNIGVVEGVPRIDREVYALFERELPGARFYPFADVWDRGLPVTPSQTWISTRFHFHMAAAAAGASGVAISVRPDYYATKHRSLTALGSGWTVVEDLDQLPGRPTGGGFDPAVLAELKRGKQELAKSIYRPVVRQSGGGDNDVVVTNGSQPSRRRWARILRG